MTLSRRFVFKTIFGGTAAVATLAVTQAKQLRAPEQKWDDVVDIIVIGGGLLVWPLFPLQLNEA